MIVTDDQQSPGRTELGDGASRANDHADGEGSVADADLVRRSTNRTSSAGSRRTSQPHQAEILVVGSHGIFLVTW